MTIPQEQLDEWRKLVEAATPPTNTVSDAIEQRAIWQLGRAAREAVPTLIDALQCDRKVTDDMSLVLSSALIARNEAVAERDAALRQNADLQSANNRLLERARNDAALAAHYGEKATRLEGELDAAIARAERAEAETRSIRDEAIRCRDLAAEQREINDDLVQKLDAAREEVSHHIVARQQARSDLEAALSQVSAMRETLQRIRIYGNDTLSGRVDGAADKAWFRESVVEMRNRAHAALEAAEKARPNIPDGWKLVPIEPTEAMIDAGNKWVDARNAWEDMLAASPEPTKE